MNLFALGTLPTNRDLLNRRGITQLDTTSGEEKTTSDPAASGQPLSLRDMVLGSRIDLARAKGLAKTGIAKDLVRGARPPLTRNPDLEATTMPGQGGLNLTKRWYQQPAVWSIGALVLVGGVGYLYMRRRSR